MLVQLQYFKVSNNIVSPKFLSDLMYNFLIILTEVYVALELLYNQKYRIILQKYLFKMYYDYNQMS